MYKMNFSFGKNSIEDSTKVSSAEFFNMDKGFGIVPFDAPASNSYEKIFDSGCWTPQDGLDISANAPVFTESAYGLDLNSQGWPLRFRAAVPEEGVYAVTLNINGGNEGLSDLNIYTGRRNLLRRDVNIKPGEEFNHRFFVHICGYIPQMGKPPKTDLSVHIAVTGKTARISSVTIEKAEAPTLFIAGDSIVADYLAAFPYNPLITGGAWGHYILQYLDGIAVNNQAHGGMTTNCFRDDGHFDIIMKRIKPGDVFMFQFGHNDQKRRNLAAFGGYTSNLRWYINQIRKKGAIPVIVTSLSRIPSKDEFGWYDLLEDHAEACRRVGKELQVPVIDLHQYSFDLFCSMDSEKIKGYFNDAAHTNDYGAILITEFIAKEIDRLNIQPLCEHINNRYPEAWIPNEELRPKKSENPMEKPELPILSTEMIELPYIDCKHISQLPVLKEAMARGLLDPCLKYFHPFDEMPRGQFLFMFFKGAKAPEKRPYQGKYCDINRYEWDAQFIQAADDLNLIDESTIYLDRFRPDDGLTGGELLSIFVRYLHKPEKRNISIAECERQANSLGLIWAGYERNKKVNRADCTVALVRMLKVTEEEKLGLSDKY